MVANPHPNATVAGGSTGAGLLAVWLLGHFGVKLDAEEGGLIAGGAATIVLFIGRHGLQGLWRLIWKGTGQAAVRG